jgi:hypothetical protein
MSAYAQWLAAELGDEASWARLATDWDAIGQPFQAAYARFRAAEAAVADRRLRAFDADPSDKVSS